MRDKFQDLFSGHTKQYATFRPVYPVELYHYLSSLTRQHKYAWDCATGTGQAAVQLAKSYKNVIATDASEKQINNAMECNNVEYRTALADNSNIEPLSLDLITVGQALHWLNLETFYNEVQRVLKPEGILAVWTYNLMQINPALDEIITHLYHHVLGEYWSFERQAVENGYQDIEFPLNHITPPEFEMQQAWELSHLIGYLNTWSAVKDYEKQNKVNPVEHCSDKLITAWGDPEKSLTIKWPLTLKVWRK